MNDFAPLMTSAYLAHKEFHSTWDKYYSDTTKPEPREVTVARDRFDEQHYRLFNHISKYVKGFFAGDPSAIDAILDFLETDIPAFRCGYVKEKFFRRLKSMSLNSAQTERVRNLALELCKTESYRREFRDLVRLTIKLADTAFVGRIRGLVESSDGIVKFKSQLMLSTILSNRKDLS